MKDDTSSQVPESRDPRKEVAAAAKEAIAKAKQRTLSDGTEDDLEWNDPEADVGKEYNSSAWINAVLDPAKLNVRSGYRDRFVVAAPDDFPGAPALLINMGKRVERVFEGKKTATAAAGTGAKATNGTKSAKAAAKPADRPAPAPATPDEGNAKEAPGT